MDGAVNDKQQPVTIYDPSTDDDRPITQADADRLMAIADCFRSTRSIIRKIVEMHWMQPIDLILLRDKLRDIDMLLRK